MRFPIFEAIQSELKKADTKHSGMAEMVEGLHTLKCEVAELEREIMRKNFSPGEMTNEAIQVATMATKFLRDCCGMSVTHDEGTQPETDKISIRGQEWLKFSAEVFNHIESYTVPQYGDKGTDRASEYDMTTIAEHIGRYRDRMGSNSRGAVEAKRDMIKIAHYASFGHDLI